LSILTKEMLAYYAREAYWCSPLLQNSYSVFAILQANLKKGRFERLESYCDAARRVLDPAAKARAMRRFATFVAYAFAKDPPRTLVENPFIISFFESDQGRRIIQQVSSWSAEKRLRLAGNVAVLKSPRGRERGVLLVKFTPHFFTFLANFDLQRVTRSFRLVLAPSWYLYPSPYWAMFSCTADPVIVTCFDRDVAAAMAQTGMHLTTLPIGPQDWIDTDVFRPLPGTRKEFDIVMIASFQRLKRHRVLFKTMKALRPRRIKVALIGATWERTRQEFEREIASFGVESDCTIFQGLKPEGVNEVLNRSRISVVLSKMEGGNKAVTESLAADVPCLLREGVIGIREIPSRCGIYSTDEELPKKLVYLLDHTSDFEPRKTLLTYSGVHRSTQLLNDKVKELAQSAGEPWTEDLVGVLHKYAGLDYLSDTDRQRCEPGWALLRECLAENQSFSAVAP
jgi:glycosyltransferase involved in cell wall biosynthesis